MNKLPIVTAILPCYNHSKWVQDAVLSIVNQTYKNTRIVFVDDASTDDSYEKVLELCENVREIPVKLDGEPAILKSGHVQKVPIILAKFKNNYGPSTSRNYGIKSAWDDTDVYAFLDCDDFYCSNEKISKSLKSFIEFGDLIGVVYSDFITINKITGLECREFKQPFSRQLLLKECIISMNSLVNKTMFDKCGLFDETISLCEDFDMWLRGSEKAIMIHIPEALVKIRVGGNSTSIVRNKEEWEKSYSYIFNKLNQRLQNN